MPTSFNLDDLKNATFIHKAYFLDGYVNFYAETYHSLAIPISGDISAVQGSPLVLCQVGLPPSYRKKRVSQKRIKSTGEMGRGNTQSPGKSREARNRYSRTGILAKKRAVTSSYVKSLLLTMDAGMWKDVDAWDPDRLSPELKQAIRSLTGKQKPAVPCTRCGPDNPHTNRNCPVSVGFNVPPTAIRPGDYALYIIKGCAGDLKMRPPELYAISSGRQMIHHDPPGFVDFISGLATTKVTTATNNENNNKAITNTNLEWGTNLGGDHSSDNQEEALDVAAVSVQQPQLQYEEEHHESELKQAAVPERTTTNQSSCIFCATDIVVGEDAIASFYCCPNQIFHLTCFATMILTLEALTEDPAGEDDSTAQVLTGASTHGRPVKCFTCQKVALAVQYQVGKNVPEEAILDVLQDRLTTRNYRYNLALQWHIMAKALKENSKPPEEAIVIEDNGDDEEVQAFFASESRMQEFHMRMEQSSEGSSECDMEEYGTFLERDIGDGDNGDRDSLGSASAMYSRWLRTSIKIQSR